MIKITFYKYDVCLRPADNKLTNNYNFYNWETSIIITSFEET